MGDNVVQLSFGYRQPRRLNPDRLSKARKAARLTQTDLALKVGLTRQAISAFEQGTKHPEAETMVALSRELNQPLTYFTTPSPPVFGPFSARTFRAFGAATKRRNEQCAVLSEWLTSITSYLSSMVNYPPANLPSIPPPLSEEGYQEEEIEAAATAVRRHWGLGDGPIGNLLKLVESQGVFVSWHPITGDSVNAFSFRSGSVPFIMMGSESTSAVRRRFDIAHELGHLVLHQGIDETELEDRKTFARIEAEANRFAGALLLPAATYPNEVFSGRLDAFVHLKDRWKVAISAQIYRCSDLGLFSDHQILNMRKQLSARKWRKEEPLDDSLQTEMPSLIAKGVELLLKQKLAPEDLVNAINLNEETVEILAGLTPGTLSHRAPPKGPTITLK